MAKRNVLFIVVDQWRADFVPHLMRAAGRTPFFATPNLDRLCAEGVTFADHVTVTVPCGPARASLLTGLYQMNHRAAQNTVPLDRRHPTLPHAVRALGLDPALVGYTTTAPDPRGASPNDPRFLSLGDDMAGFRPVGSFGPDMDGYFGWVAQQGFPLPPNREDIWLPEGEDAVPGATDRPARIPAALSDSAYFTDAALRYLKGRDGKPFFLHLGYYRPHPPFVAPAPYHAMFAPTDMPAVVRAASWEDEARQHPLLGFYLGSIAQGSFFHGAEGEGHALDEAAIAQMRATYCGLIREIDDQLGRVFAFLDETEQWDDTLVVFTSDHGEQLGDHHLLGKMGYFDESFRIPLVVKAPGAPGGGRIERSPTESVDLMPTMIDWLGGTPPGSCDGRSLLPFLAGSVPAGWRTELHYEYDFRDVHYSAPEKPLGLSQDEASLCVVQDGRYKYVHFAALPPLFFDLARDPNQFDDRAGDPDYAELVKSYAQKALSWRLIHADRTLGRYRSGPRGLELRGADGAAAPLRDLPVPR